MNPISRLFLYIIFSISILLSTNIYLLFGHIILVIIIFFHKRAFWSEWWRNIKPYIIYLPLSGILFFLISWIFLFKPISILFIDVLIATIRLFTMISLMNLYTIESRSHSLLISIRSIWFSSGLNMRWADRIVLFFEMTLRFFPSIQQDWNQTQRSQKALALNIQNTNMFKIINIAKFLPDFILLNLERTDNILDNMSMRGYGKKNRRSIFPFLEFTTFDIIICFLTPICIMGIHYFF